MSLVIDASVTLAWCFEDEASPETDAIAELVRERGAVVPSLWHLELISVLPILIDHETPGRAWREVLALARSQKLTTYDAAYLELALRRGFPLASQDSDLIAAAKGLGVQVLM